MRSYRHYEGQHHKDKPEPDFHLRKGGVVYFPLEEEILKREQKGRWIFKKKINKNDIF